MIRSLVLGFIAVVAVLFVVYNPGVVTQPFYHALDTVRHPAKHQNNSPLNGLLPAPDKVGRLHDKKAKQPKQRPSGFGAGAVAVQRAHGL